MKKSRRIFAQQKVHLRNKFQGIRPELAVQIDWKVLMISLGLTKHTFYKYVVKHILCGKICVNHSGIAPRQPVCCTEMCHWDWVKMRILQQKYCPRYLLSDLCLHFLLKDFKLCHTSYERAPRKHRKEAKAGVDHFVMLTQMGRTVMMYY